MFRNSVAGPCIIQTIGLSGINQASPEKRAGNGRQRHPAEISTGHDVFSGRQIGFFLAIAQMRCKPVYPRMGSAQQTGILVSRGLDAHEHRGLAVFDEWIGESGAQPTSIRNAPINMMMRANLNFPDINSKPLV